MTSSKDINQTFPLEKILTVGLEDYISFSKLVRTNGLDNYNLVGVHIDVSGNYTSLINEFAKKVPINAEVVVDYRADVSVSCSDEDVVFVQVASGTALVPKK